MAAFVSGRNRSGLWKVMKNIFFAALHIFLGTVLAVTVFEVALRANPSLLLRGMALPAPVDPPLTRRVYDVHYSDADAFVWRPDMICPVKPEEHRLGACGICYRRTRHQPTHLPEKGSGCVGQIDFPGYFAGALAGAPF
jgi:hypothetical protein